MQKQQFWNESEGELLPPYDYQQNNSQYPPESGHAMADDDDISEEYPTEDLDRAPLIPNTQNLGYQPYPPEHGSFYPSQHQGINQQLPSMAIVVQPITNQPPVAPLTNPPPSNLAYAIFTTMCCCWLIGIVAIARAVECRSAIAAGNRPLAELKSREAMKMAHVALAVGIVLIIFTTVINVWKFVVVK